MSYRVRQAAQIVKDNLVVQFSVLSFVMMAAIAEILSIVLSNKIRSDAIDALCRQ